MKVECTGRLQAHVASAFSRTRLLGDRYAGDFASLGRHASVHDFSKWPLEEWTFDNLCAFCGHPRNCHLGEARLKGLPKEDDSGWCTLSAGTCIFNPCKCTQFIEPRPFFEEGMPMSELDHHRLVALAIQLSFTANEQIESDTEAIEGVGADTPTPPTRWSPLRSISLWNALPEKVQKAWLDYAKKVSPFVPHL